MARFKATPKSYAEALQVLGCRESVKLGHNTWLERLNGLGFIGIRYHNTYVVRFHENGAVTLHTGGYHTVTTKQRLNAFVPGNIYQKNFEWFYSNGYGPEAKTVEFSEGLNVAAL